ncbi:YggS family pyridoxal phosphate-dependent enzyme [Chryseobacterium sp. MFBS3-17]|uniref:YggS family pyridoxal phosphate-dependent enzyme n=1 Tax=Chryseobacterium sp. MFBS3-17 TaxID=2886689 RepID=UPI001D0ED6F6|nr:YggS family pyridoxal phosphate-dependent enzyme [Chryseobacterium sp. MFBS3-17]MCC2591656.1 YggS family pyridoxal phosphate-dependent enzyme [Chryseobacterium sp. MFBS3-17]
MNHPILQENYKNICKKLPPHVQLVVVSKTHPVAMIQNVYDMGQRHFGENKVQELLEKQPLLPEDICWHLIGHLQTNKVKQIIHFIDVIESVDSRKLMAEINKHAAKANRTVKVLLQVKIAEEDTKFGLEVSETKELFLEWMQGQYPNVEVNGLMGMATFTDDEAQVSREFSFLKQLFKQLSLQKELTTLSMGMSGDYPVAIDCGSTSVRIGSAIFGERDYL